MKDFGVVCCDEMQKESDLFTSQQEVILMMMLEEEMETQQVPNRFYLILEKEIGCTVISVDH